ncbi:MAG: HAD family hydrolase [Alkalimonas sp.]|nr:HAD family hydrolase [Alkalimonas sp.]
MMEISSALGKQIQAVAFDLDGTLVHSSLDFTAIRQELNWPADTDLLARLQSIEDPEQRRAADAVIRRHEMAAAETSYLLPGVLACLQQLHGQGIPTAILTRNMRQATLSMLERLQIPIRLVLTREDCAAKPDPEGLHRIARQFEISTSQLLYIGDYHFDLTTAANAGAVSCLLLNEHNQHFASLADWVVSDYPSLTRALTR